MARTRTAGAGGASAWALVIFGLGFGLCLVLSIVFYVQLQGERQATETANQDLRKFVSGPQQSSPDIVRRLDQRDRGTVVQQLLDEHNTLRGLITTDPEADIEAIRARLESSQLGTPLLREMERLVAELDDADQRVTGLQQELTEERQRTRSLDQRLAQVTNSFDDSVRDLDGRLNRSVAQFTDYRGQVERLEQDLSRRVQEVHRSREDRILQLERERDELRRDRDRIQQALNEARQRDLAISPPDLILPDGQITSLSNGGDNVFINLGRRQQIVRGMTFEVFSAGRPIHPNDAGQARGKATIQVFEVGENSSQARVVRRQPLGRDRDVATGDPIVNLAYSPDTVYTFYVHGRFDMQRTGVPSTADQERIKTIIRRWGGRVRDEMNHEVDFVVLGVEPPHPGSEPATIDPAEIRAHTEALRSFERHHEVVNAARAQSIPVLNQNQFLNMVGYFTR